MFVALTPAAAPTALVHGAALEAGTDPCLLPLWPWGSLMS